jgi:hypothetical protein
MSSSALAGIPTTSAAALPSGGRVERLLKKRWVLICGVWAVPALLASSETYLFWRMGGRDYPFWRAIVMEGPRG